MKSRRQRTSSKTRHRIARLPRSTARVWALAACVALLSACGQSERTPAEVRLQGAGATFPNPLYQKWFSEYNKVTPGVKFDYQSIGSGGGIKQITAKTIDFGGSDAPMTDEQLASSPAPILHIPTVLGAVVIAYNLPEVQGELKFTAEALAGIFLGKVQKWNDPAIVSANPGAKLPSAPISVVHRSDGSGTTFVWTDYLSKVSSEWKEKVGTGTAVNWPAGMGAKGNEGVSGQIKQTPYSVGYVELIYAEQNKLSYGSIRNAEGAFVKPTLESVTAAAASSAGSIPDDLRVSITNPPGKDAYPAASFTYILVFRDQQDAGKGKALVDFLLWAIHDGESMATDLLYAPLPEPVVKKAEEKIRSVTSQGKALLAS